MGCEEKAESVAEVNAQQVFNQEQRAEARPGLPGAASKAALFPVPNGALSLCQKDGWTVVTLPSLHHKPSASEGAGWETGSHPSSAAEPSWRG